MKLTKKFLLSTIIGSIVPAASAHAEYPKNPIRLIIPYSPGGLSDSIARTIAEYMEKNNDIKLIIENKTGGNTIPAVLALKNAKPDGYTIGWFSSSTVSTMPVVEKELPYTQKDLKPGLMIYQGPIVLAVSNQVPANDAASYIDFLKKSGTTGLVGVTANGGAGHLTAVSLGLDSGAKIDPVIYRGGPPMTTELVGGLLPASMDILDTFRVFNEDQKLKIIGYTGTKKIPTIPNVKTFGESGYPDVKGRFWHGIFFPPGTPDDIVEKLNKLMSQAIASPQVKQRLTVDLDASPNTPAEFSQIIKEDTEYWSSVAKRSGL